MSRAPPSPLPRVRFPPLLRPAHRRPRARPSAPTRGSCPPSGAGNSEIARRHLLSDPEARPSCESLISLPPPETAAVRPTPARHRRTPPDHGGPARRGPLLWPPGTRQSHTPALSCFASSRYSLVLADFTQVDLVDGFLDE